MYIKNKQSTLNATLYYVLINGAYLAVAVAGLVYQITWAKNIFFFVFTLQIALSILMLLGTLLAFEKQSENLAKSGRFAAKWLEYLVEIFMTGLLVVTGHLIMGFFYMLMAILTFWMRKAVTLYAQKHNS